MDRVVDDVEVLSKQRSVETPNNVISHGKWEVKELTLTQEKVDWIWEQVQKSPSLFSDLTKGKAHAFVALLEDPGTYWLEVMQDDKVIGVVYLSELHQIIDANIHILFFDRDLSDKGLLMKDIFEFFFNKFPALNRISASIPDIYFATKRLALKSGMLKEGRRRSSLLIGGRWQDEVLFGILASEVLNGTN